MQGHSLAERRSVAEGMESAPAVVALAAKYEVEMPICAAVDAIVNERIGIDEAITALLSRPFKAESAFDVSSAASCLAQLDALA